MGGPSSEHEISLHSARAVIKALDPARYRVRPVLITRDGAWHGAPLFLTPAAALALVEKNKEKKDTRMMTNNSDVRMVGAGNFAKHSLTPWSMSVGSAHPDVIFIALHGAYGEDGRVQRLLDSINVPYTGSGVLASALAMDKSRAAHVLRGAGLAVPDFVVMMREAVGEPSTARSLTAAVRKLGVPLVIKPADQGSSVGVTIVKKREEISAALTHALREFPVIMGQKYIAGREVTCGILEDPKTGKAFALPPTEIIPTASAFFDYDAKYTAGASQEITPARMPAATIRRIQETALAAHRALGCRGMSRTDIIVAKGRLWVLEVNTIPGMTATSLLPQGAAAAGISFPALVDTLITSAFRTTR